MEPAYVRNWDAFTAEIQKLRDDLPNNASGQPPELLFRGQSNSDWRLNTTLERADCEGMSFDEYYRLAVARAKPAVEAFTGTMWEVPDHDTTLEETFRSDRELFSSRKFPSVEFYRYMVYLRHHGFRPDGIPSSFGLTFVNPSRQSNAIVPSNFIYKSWRVGRNRISFTSTSSGWLIAKATTFANDSAGIATAS
jgi:hypothetical protein